MAVFRTFKALRPVPEKAEQVAALPYDVVSREEAAAIGEKNPYSFLHIDRAEIDLGPEVDCMKTRYIKRPEKIWRKWKKRDPCRGQGTFLLYI